VVSSFLTAPEEDSAENAIFSVFPLTGPRGNFTLKISYFPVRMAVESSEMAPDLCPVVVS
jgi:hypothetical protein